MTPSCKWPIAHHSFTSSFSYYKETRLWQRSELLSYTLFASTSDKKFEIFKKLGQKNKTKQNKTKTIKQSFFENRRMLFFSECIQNITSDLKAICFVIFARKVFVSLNFGHYFESIAYSLGY